RVVQGGDASLPVAVYVPGCPPRPEQLIQSILDLQKRIKETGTLNGKEFARRTVPEGPQPVRALPTDAVVAPGDFTASTRLRGQRLGTEDKKAEAKDQKTDAVSQQ